MVVSFFGVAVLHQKGLASARGNKRAQVRPFGRWAEKKGRWVSEEISPEGDIRTSIK